MKNINFEKSSFKITNRFLQTEVINSEIGFNSISEIRDYERKNGGHRVHPKHIQMLSNLSYDLFKIGGFSFDWIITKKVKEELEYRNMKGYEIREISWLS